MISSVTKYDCNAYNNLNGPGHLSLWSQLLNIFRKELKGIVCIFNKSVIKHII